MYIHTYRNIIFFYIKIDIQIDDRYRDRNRYKCLNNMLINV